jgi:hypothetical protein
MTRVALPLAFLEWLLIHVSRVPRATCRHCGRSGGSIRRRSPLQYYGRFTPSALRPIEPHVGQSLVRWACQKYKSLRGHRTRAWVWPLRVIHRQPDLLALWERQRGKVSTIPPI